MPNKTIKIITEKRSDAIHIYCKSLIHNLKKEGANIKIITLNNKPFRNLYINFIVEIFNSIRTIFLINRNDIVLFTDPLALYTLISIFVPNKKYLIFYHYEKDPFYYKFIPFVSYKNILNKFDGIICISKFTLSQINKLGVDTKKCKVIYCGIDHNLFKPCPSEQYSFDYILAVGSEEPRKNMVNILKCFKELKKDFPGLKLLKLGYVSPQNRKKTMHYVNKLKLEKDIIFIDFIEEKKLPEIYSGAKLLLFPSLLEGFGYPIVEAMACGCPVVTSNINPMLELVGEQVTVDPLNPSKIAIGCRKILKDKNYRNLIVKNGINRAKKFDWTNIAKEIKRFVTSNM